MPMVFTRSRPSYCLHWPSGMVGSGVVWWNPGSELHPNAIRKIIWKGMGTWGSNPGPRDYQYYALPTALLCIFVYYITNKHYKIKQTLVPFSARKFERTNQRLTPHLLLLRFVFFCLKHEKVSGDFKPHQNMPVFKIAIRPSLSIN